MKTLLLFLPFAALLWQARPESQPPVAQPEYMRYERSLSLPPGNGQACAALDAQIFPHAEPALGDLRVFPVQASGAAATSASTREIPYVITLSQTANQNTEPVTVLNLGGVSAGRIAFDLRMPQRPYSNVVLDITGTDFLATATVWGEGEPATPPARRTELGAFTLFDLAAQHLSRDTTLPLAESTFPFLHVELAMVHAPGAPPATSAFAPSIVTGAEVPPSRTAQTIYTTVAETHSITVTRRESHAIFQIPARVPVERVAFELASGYAGNFSRDVRITATPAPVNAENGQADPRGADTGGSAGVFHGGEVLPEETVSGTILRVHTTEAGREIRTELLGVSAILGANLQGPASVEVALENGDDQPLPITAVRLQMRQRRLCVEAGSDRSAGLALFYGDGSLRAPVYDYQRLFRPVANPLIATLGPELANPAYKPRPAAALPFTERYPQVLWIALIAVVCVLGAIAVRASKNVGG